MACAAPHAPDGSGTRAVTHSAASVRPSQFVFLAYHDGGLLESRPFDWTPPVTMITNAHRMQNYARK